MAGVKKPGAAACGLYIRLGPDLAGDVLMRDLQQIIYVINASPYEKNMHAVEIGGNFDDPQFRADAEKLFGLARAKGMTCIWRGGAEQAKALNADGVLVDTIEKLAEAKKLFDLAGLYCGTSRERAAEAHDAGADFVSFGTSNRQMPSVDALRFWVILSDMPAIIEGPVTNDYCAYYVQAGASFVDATDYIWSHGKGVMQATSNMLYAIELALEEQQQKERRH